MKSTHIIYKNEIVELATLCVIRKIQNKFQNKNMYLNFFFVENDSIFFFSFNCPCYIQSVFVENKLQMWFLRVMYILR